MRHNMNVTASPFAASAALPAVQAGLSIVVPLFNEGAGLAGFHARLSEIARQLRQQRGLATEVVYVDDGSRDDSLAVAQALPAEALDVQVVSLSRNFGKEAALLAGLDHARLGAVLFMDGDGQQPRALVFQGGRRPAPPGVPPPRGRPWAGGRKRGGFPPKAPPPKKPGEAPF